MYTQTGFWKNRKVFFAHGLGTRLCQLTTINSRKSVILVYSLDRFSRTGDNDIFISSELKKRGISILSVTQPIDVSTHSGVLHQNIQFIFSRYDNDLRREKCIAGMKEKLLRGEWTGVAPLGWKVGVVSMDKVV